MTPKTVGKVMIPLESYATVSEEASLIEALLALDEVRAKMDLTQDKHRGILVCDKAGNVVGKVDLWDLLKGVEPKYRSLGYPRQISEEDCCGEFVDSLRRIYGLWKGTLDEICSRASRLKVTDVMHMPDKGEYIEEDATLEEAINRLIAGNLQSLLVTRDGKVTGVLRLSDILQEVIEKIRICVTYSQEEEDAATGTLAA